MLSTKRFVELEYAGGEGDNLIEGEGEGERDGRCGAVLAGANREFAFFLSLVPPLPIARRIIPSMTEMVLELT